MQKQKITKEELIEAIAKNSRVNNDLWFLQGVLADFKNDLDVALSVVKKNAYFLKYFSDSIKDNNLIANEVLKKKDGEILEHLSPRLKNDKNYVLKFIKIAPGCLEFVSEELKNDPEIAYHAIKQNDILSIYLSSDLQKICKQENPVERLKALYLCEKIYEEINTQIPYKEEPSQSKKMKI